MELFLKVNNKKVENLTLMCVDSCKSSVCVDHTQNLHLKSIVVDVTVFAQIIAKK